MNFPAPLTTQNARQVTEQPQPNKMSIIAAIFLHELKAALLLKELSPEEFISINKLLANTFNNHSINFSSFDCSSCTINRKLSIPCWLS